MATNKIYLAKNKKQNKFIIYTCEKHKPKNDKNHITGIVPFDQIKKLWEVNRYLLQFIGKEIRSTQEYNILQARYIKPNTGGIMCYCEKKKSWCFVYHYQIKEH